MNQRIRKTLARSCLRMPKGEKKEFFSFMSVHTHIHYTPSTVHVQKPINCNKAVTIIIITIMMLNDN